MTSPPPPTNDPLSDSARDLRQRLLHRIHQRYATVAQQIRIGPLDLTFTRIANPDIVLDQVAEEEDRRERRNGHRVVDEELHLPYWAELWDSATGIGRFLLGPRGQPLLRPPGRSHASVLDLGCGMGLSGTIAAAAGAHVLFADLEPPALLFARLNSLPWRSRIRTRRLNWQIDNLSERFDLIIGADILYERKQWQHLEPFWRAHLAPGGSVLLGEPGRQTGELFLDWIRPRGWRLSEYDEPVPSRPRPIRVFHLTLAAE